MSPKISIIVPVREINDYIREASRKHLALEYSDFEVLILPDHDSNEYLGPLVRVIPTHPKNGPADKRDFGAREALGEILAFIDDDAYPHKDWLKNAVGYFEDSKVAAVCGPGVTPPGDSVDQKVSGWIQASKLGGGQNTYRFIPQKKRFVDDYPSMNLLVRKKDFEEVGGFDSHFWPGEDTKLCHDFVYGLKKEIIYDPSVLVYHHRRGLWRPHLKQVGGYGLHRGHFARILPETSRRLFYFIPTLFTLGLIFGPLLIFATKLILPILTNFLFWFYFLSVGLYSAFLALTALWVFRHSKDIRVSLLTIPGVFITHICYGLRFTQGFFSRNLRR